MGEIRPHEFRIYLVYPCVISVIKNASVLDVLRNCYFAIKDYYRIHYYYTPL